MIVKMKLIWAWIKKNWKILLGAAIPIAIGIILRRGNAKQIWKEMSESKDKEIDMKAVSYTHLTLPTILLV